jgi:hypothetical protein
MAREELIVSIKVFLPHISAKELCTGRDWWSKKCFKTASDQGYIAGVQVQPRNGKKQPDYTRSNNRPSKVPESWNEHR